MSKRATDKAPEHETPAERLERLRELARTKQVTAVWWPGDAKTKKQGDELHGQVADVTMGTNKAPDGTSRERRVYAVRRMSDGVLVNVGGNVVLDREWLQENVGIGDEVLIVYRGKETLAGGHTLNTYAVVVVARAGQPA